MICTEMPPAKEMSWCFEHHIYITPEKYAEVNNGVYYEKDKYRILVKEGVNEERSDYIYTRRTVQYKINELYRFLYNKHHAESTKE